MSVLCCAPYLEKETSLEARGIANEASLMRTLRADASGEYLPGPTGETFRGLTLSSPLSDLGTENYEVFLVGEVTTKP
jgi:hypothetical protein